MNLTRMSVVLLLSFLMQITISQLRKLDSICVAFAVLLHWTHLTSFSWMAAASFDLFLTFNFPGQLDLDTRKRWFSLCNQVCFGLPTVLVLLCLLLEFSGEKVIGYGASGVCFVAHMWANLFAFAVPVGILLLFNTICLVCTIRSIYLTQKRTDEHLKKTKSNRKKSMHLVIMTLKISTLTGLGWISQFITSSMQSATLTYISLFLTTYQGVFIFLGFVSTKRVRRLYKEKLKLFQSKRESRLSLNL